MPEPYLPIPLPEHEALSDTEALARADAVLARMRRRHSVREFSDAPVPRAVVERCIEVAATAPPARCTSAAWPR